MGIIYLFGFLNSENEEKVEERGIYEYIACPVCGTIMDVVKKTGLSNYGFHHICPKCQIDLREQGDNLYLEFAPKHTKFHELYRYNFKSLDEWYKIGQGGLSDKEEKEFSKLEKIEDTNELCPVCCQSYLEKYKKNGIFSFDSLVCPSCSVRFEINYNQIQFIYIKFNEFVLWQYYRKFMSMDEIKGILGTPQTQEINYKEYDEEKIEEYNQTNVVNKRFIDTTNKSHIFSKIDYNHTSKSELLNIKTLNQINIGKLIRLKELGIVFNSYDDLNEILNLDSEELEYMKQEILINQLPEHQNTTEDNQIENLLNDQSNDKDLQNNQIDTLNKIKTDLNTASLDDLTQLPGINLIKAKKIIQFRNEGNYIKSYDDLGVKLSLTDKQIEQIKNITIISDIDYSQGRVIDF